MFLTMAPGNRSAADASSAPRSLPRGPHGLERDVVLASQRGRMLGAVADAVADKGYAGTTVADVVAGAGVSRKTFYEHFRDKEECFLAAFDSGVDALLEAIAAAEPDEPTRMSLVRARVRAYLVTLAARPAFARTFLIEVFAAGPHALERRERVHARFEQFLRGLHSEARREFPDLPEVRDIVWVAAVGALNEVVTQHVREGRTEELPELEDTLVEIQAALLGVPRESDLE
jgi:AcrR family transcriptional regulator